MSHDAMTWAARQKAGTPARKAVLMYLADKADENHSCYPSQATMARVTELSERTVRSAVKALEAAGHLRRQPRFDGNEGRTSDRYVLNVSLVAAVSSPQSPPATVATGKSFRPHKPVPNGTETPLPATAATGTDAQVTKEQNLKSKPFAAEAARQRERNPIWDAVVQACRIVPAEVTRDQSSLLGKVVRDLREVGATADDVKVRARRYTQSYPGAALTPTALAKHWSSLGAAWQPPAADRFTQRREVAEQAQTAGWMNA